MHSKGGFDANSEEWKCYEKNSAVDYMDDENSHINIFSNHDRDGK